MQVYDLQISSASDVERINAQGNYIYYSYGSAGGSNPCVEVRGINTGFRVKLLPGQGMRLPMGKVERDWMIKPDASIAGSLIGAVVIGEGEIFDNRVTGTVNVVDGGKLESEAGNAYICSFARTSTVGNKPVFQLRNSGLSGRKIAVKSMSFSLNLDGYIMGSLNYSNVGNESGLVRSKKSDGGILGGLMHYADSPTLVRGDLIFFNRLKAFQSYQVKFEEPILLMDGANLTFCSEQNNVDFGGFIELNLM